MRACFHSSPGPPPILPLCPYLSFLGAPHTALCCCCCCCRRSRSCHNCKVSGRRRSSPAGSSRLTGRGRTGEAEPGQRRGGRARGKGVKGGGAGLGGSGVPAAWCLLCIPCPRAQFWRPLLLRKAAEGRSREGSPKAAPAPSLCHRAHSQGLDAHLSSASLLVLPRHVAVNEVNLLRVSVSWGGQGMSASIWGPSGTRPMPETPSPDPTTHQSRLPSAPGAPEAPGPAPRSGRTTPKIHLLTRNARMGESCSVVLGVPGVHALWVCC